MRNEPRQYPVSEVPPELLAWRRKTGVDRYDEIWDGVYHMVPAPNRAHQDFRWAFETFLRRRWARTRNAKVYSEVNVARVGGWPNDYRIPDIILLTPERLAIDRNEYFEGAPEVVVEICSPGDESEEKLEFYADVGVPEAWLIERDTKAVRVFRWRDGAYEVQVSDADGWFASVVTVIRMRPTNDGRLEVQMGNDPASLEVIPEP